MRRIEDVTCDECNKRVDVAIFLGDEAHDNEIGAYVCADCLAEALQMAGGYIVIFDVKPKAAATE